MADFAERLVASVASLAATAQAVEKVVQVVFRFLSQFVFAPHPEVRPSLVVGRSMRSC